MKGANCLSVARELSRETKFLTVGIRALVDGISREELVLELWLVPSEGRS